MTGERFLLDATVVSYFFNAGLEDTLLRIADVLELHVVREAHDELASTNRPLGRKVWPKAAEYEAWHASSGIRVRDIDVGGVGATLLAALRKPFGSIRDLGELASIALACEDESLTLVTHDKGAAWIALRELTSPWEHVIRLPTFLLRAQSPATLRRTELEAIAKYAQLDDAAPTWWWAWQRGLR